MSGRRLSELSRVASTLLEAELAGLRQLGARVDALHARLAALEDAVSRQHAVIAAELDAPLAGPVLDRWGAWAERRRAALNTALARELGALEARRAAAALAFGRAEALRLVSGKADAEARQKAKRAALRL